VAGTNEKGNFSANIAQEVIDAALKSVERRGTHSESGEGVALEVESAEPQAGEGGASVEVSGLMAELEAARKEVESFRAQLEFSQGESRKLMERLKDDHERSLRASARP
jgi:molecular chaperone GrpE